LDVATGFVAVGFLAGIGLDVTGFATGFTGYNDYENKHKQFEETFRRVAVPESLQEEPVDETLDVVTATEETKILKVKNRKTLKGFMDSFKIGLIDLFKEEEDAKL
jgi:hypothetical protein